MAATQSKGKLASLHATRHALNAVYGSGPEIELAVSLLAEHKDETLGPEEFAALIKTILDAMESEGYDISLMSISDLTRCFLACVTIYAGDIDSFTREVHLNVSAQFAC